MTSSQIEAVKARLLHELKVGDDIHYTPEGEHPACSVRKSDLSTFLTYVKNLEKTLSDADELCRYALPKFNWGASALDADAIRLLNEVPGKIGRALKGE
jgi:hypothetical protein